MHALLNRKTSLIAYLLPAGIAVVLIWPFLPVLVPDEYARLVLSDLIFPAFCLLATVASLQAAFRGLNGYRRAHRAWGLIAVGMFFWFLADSVWGILELGLQQQPYPSIADVFYLLFYVLFTVGILCMPSRPFSRLQLVKTAIDLGVVLASSTLIFWNFLIGPLAVESTGESLAITVISLAYPVCGLSMLASLLTLMFRQIEMRRKPLFFLVLGTVLMILTDSIYGYQVLQGTYVSGGALDVGWLAAILCIALAGFWQEPAAQPTTDRQTNNADPTSLRWVVFLPYLFLLPAYAMMIWGYYADLPMAFPPLAAAISGIVGCIVIRQILVQVENIWLNRELRKELGERQRAEAALRISEDRYALAARGANDGLWDWDLQTGTVYFSQRWKAMVGYENDGLDDVPETWFNRVHPDDIQHLQLEITNHLEGVSEYFQCQYRMLHRDGSYRWMLSRGLGLKDREGQVYRMAGSQTDITDQKRAEDQLLQNAFYDALTGLPNRALFLDRLNHTIRRTDEQAGEHEGKQFAVLFMDFDRFKVVNDSLGHPAGDLLLVEGARRLRECVRAVDTVSRLGGDEFVVLLEDIQDMGDILRVVERVQEAFRQPFILGGQEVFISVSTGIVASQGEYNDAEQVLRDADIALYRAKATGRARYVVFDQTMHMEAAERLKLETAIRRALERKEFRVYYQPIVSLIDGEIIGFEALVRWQHPKLGLLLPKDFLPVAEETGLIAAIDQWVLREACQQMSTWQEHFPSSSTFMISVSVNLSSKQFLQPDLVASVKRVLEETGLSPHSLRLEITESAIMGDSDAARHALLLLRELGVQVQIDDFGTGYSSLSYLQQFPINNIKIDRSFISKLHSDPNSAQIIKTIVRLAHDLGMGATAEGVETEGQLEHLRELACEYGQGYYISRPVSAQGVRRLLAHQTVAGERVAP